MPSKQFQIRAMQIGHQINGDKFYTYLETNDLIIRSPIPSDTAIIHDSCFGNAITMAKYAARIPQTSEQSAKRFQGHADKIDNGEMLHGLVICKKDKETPNTTPEPIGLINHGAGMEHNDAPTPGDTELGVIIANTEWGKGYGTQTVKAVEDHLLPSLRAHGVENHGKVLETSSATALTDNEGSVKILSRIFGEQKDQEIVERYSEHVRNIYQHDIRDDEPKYDAFIGVQALAR